MKTHTVEAQAASLEAARIELKKQLPAGHAVIEETIVNDGLSKTVEAEATTVDDALLAAKAKVPAHASVEKHEVIREPSREAREVVAFDEGEARREVAASFCGRFSAGLQTIESVSIKQAARAGFLGLGRRPGKFAVVVLYAAHVRVTYCQPAHIRGKTGTPDMIPAMTELFWESGGPIRREGLYEAQRSALLGLSAFARVGHPSATAEIKKVIEAATRTLLDIEEFSSYHGYQRQQVAAEILGLVGSEDQVKTLQSGLRLQGAHAGCSEYSNRTSTQPLVEGAIEDAIASLRRRGSAQ